MAAGVGVSYVEYCDPEEPFGLPLDPEPPSAIFDPMTARTLIPTIAPKMIINGFFPLSPLGADTG
jgi:hypothetical protein